MPISQPPPGVLGPFAGMDVPWLLRMRAETRREHPFLVWAPFDALARIWNYGEFYASARWPRVSLRAASSQANSC